MENSIDKKVIQVGGAVRSGTTILGLILANNDNSIMIGEVMHLFKPYKRAHYELRSRLINSDTKWKEILRGSRKELYSNIFKIFPNKQVIIDTSKDPFWYKDVGSQTGDKYSLQRIVSYKDADKYIASFVKRKLDNYSKVYYEYYRRYFTMFPSVSSVNISQILYDSESLRALFRILRLDYYDGVINYWEREHPNFFGSNSVNVERIEKENRVELRTGQLLTEQMKLINAALNCKSVFSSVTSEPKLGFKEIRYGSFQLGLIKLKTYTFKKYFYEL